MVFFKVRRSDSSSWNYLLSDQLGRMIDFHVFNLDEKGKGVLGPIENGDVYTRSAFEGRGMIAGVRVRCISAPALLQYHTGYVLRQKDLHDVRALCEKFGLELPKEYRGDASYAKRRVIPTNNLAIRSVVHRTEL